MQILPSVVVVAVAVAAMFAPPVKQSDSVLVRAVIDGDTIEVERFGHVRLLGIEVPAIVADAARERLSGLVLRRWVRLETEVEIAAGSHKRPMAYVVTGDGTCANTMLVRDGLARVVARGPLTRLAELHAAQAEAQRLEKGLWGYTRPPQPQKRRSSWPRSQSSTHRIGRFATATSFITASTTGRSGFLSSSSRRVR